MKIYTNKKEALKVVRKINNSDVTERGEISVCSVAELLSLGRACHIIIKKKVEVNLTDLGKNTYFIEVGKYCWSAETMEDALTKCLAFLIKLIKENGIETKLFR